MTSWGSCDRISHNPGIFGGYWGPPNPRVVIKGTDLKAAIEQGLKLEYTSMWDLLHHKSLRGQYRFEPSSFETEAFSEGDIMIWNIGAGGGYGDVLERDPAMVAEDVRQGYITLDVAERIYGVVMDPETLDVDLKATQARREAEREARKKRGKPFDEFIQQWLAKKPKPEILKYYGSWPEPRLTGYSKPFWGLYDGEAGGEAR